MTREDILKIIDGKEVDVATLNKNNSYIITVEIGSLPAEVVQQVCKRLSECLHEAQIKHFVIVPTRDNLPALKFYEFKDNQVSEVE
jgi:hypothetical protein